MILILCTIQQLTSQEENGLVALALPVRNSLRFNKYAINPTFSFVREQNKQITFTNKRQWLQFDNAPQTYVFSYSGRFRENTGAGIGLFQQDFGVISTFGALLNFAYNAKLSTNKNLTFGLNLGAYQTGINTGKVITNNPDPALNNTPSNFLLAINPGINYGTAFIDVGVSVNNLVSYNFTTSKRIEDNTEQGIQVHGMYTGYIISRGFFDESKFSMLLRSEFKEENTVLSGLAMLTVPKGIWAQAGYNSVFGVSAGLGLNITNQIAIEYNYETSLGTFSEFGASHELTLAYRFKNTQRYRYNDNDEELSVFTKKRRKAKASSISKSDIAIMAKRRSEIAAKRNQKLTGNNKEIIKPNTSKNLENTTKNKAPQTAKIVRDNAENDEDVITLNNNQNNIVSNRKPLEDKTKLQVKARTKVSNTKQAEAARKKRVEAEKLKAQTIKIKQEEANKIKLREEKEKRLEEAKRKLAAKQLLEVNRKKALEAQRRKQIEDEKARAEAAQQKLKQDARQKLKIEADKKIEATKKKEQEKAALKKQKQDSIEEQNRQKINTAVTSSNKNLKKNTQQISKKSTVLKPIVKNKDTVNIIANDEESKRLNALKNETETIKTKQRNLLTSLLDRINIKQTDLNNLKEENDLSEKGIYKTPKVFKSVTAENNEINRLKENIKNVEQEQEAKMIELEAILIKRNKKYRKDTDNINKYYKVALANLKNEQLLIKKYKQELIANLKDIKTATDFERKRRIRKAAYQNQEERYKKDKSVLEQIKKNTEISKNKLTVKDFNFGEERSANIEIIKNVVKEDNGFYMVIAVHNNTAKRDEFLSKVVSTGETNINFFYDVSTNKYYIYTQKFNHINQATQALNNKETKPYNGNMTLVKIEN